METIHTINHTLSQVKGKTINRILNILSYYPFIWTAGVLIYALIKIDFLILGIMFTWVIFLYFGLLTWLGLLNFQSLKKRITIKQTVLHILILTLGTLLAYYVLEYDLLGSGVKYMD